MKFSVMNDGNFYNNCVDVEYFLLTNLLKDSMIKMWNHKIYQKEQ